MAVELVLYFPTGQYQATPWDHAVNEGISEWPPSPWRLLRALIATWHTRCPDIPEHHVEALVSALASEAPAFLLPESKSSHTRHYLPNLEHRSDASGGTTLHFAPQLNLDPASPVRVLWPGVVLSGEDRSALAMLLEQLTYLGRADSHCSASLVPTEDVSAPDESWALPSPDGTHDVLGVEPSVTRAQLEESPHGTRRKKVRIPAGARWVRYRVPAAPTAPAPRPRVQRPTTVRWLLHTPAPFLAKHGILATHGLRGAVLGPRERHHKIEQQVADSWLVAGPHEKGRKGERHGHAHWLWRVPASQTDVPDPNAHLSELVLWVPDGIPEDLLHHVISARRLPAFSYSPAGYRGGAELHLQAMGSAEMVLPNLVSATAQRWRSVTPMLTDRFPKRNRDRGDFAQREVERELSFRWGEDAPGVRVRLLHDWESPDVVAYRRYRWTENMSQRRRGMFLELELDAPLPLDGDAISLLSLGALSHFGFGLFEPQG